MKATHFSVILAVALLAVGVPLAATYSSAAGPSHSSGPPSQHAAFHFVSSLVGSAPNTPIDGIASGGAPWVITAGNAGVTPSGVLHANVVGLLISLPGSSVDGTVGPVRTVFASLVCQGSGSIVSTNPVPLASNGNAHINQKITLPNSCTAPIILIQVYSTASGVVSPPQFYIAATGYS